MNKVIFWKGGRSLSFILSLTLALCFTSATAQHKHFDKSGNQIIRCGAVEADAALRAAHPEMGTYDQMVKRLTNDAAKMAKSGAASSKAITTMPIVFHIIHNDEAVGTGTNLSQALVNAQISQLNLDFGTAGSAASNPLVAGANTEIQFCAAMQDPNGKLMAEPGINRISATAMGWDPAQYAQAYIDGTVKPASQWDPTKYLNMWIMPLSGGLLGYAQFPDNIFAGSAGTDGVVCTSTSVGSIAMPQGTAAPYDKGRTATHEIGHWLGLLHIWGDGDCTVDDEVADTPVAGASNGGCPAGMDSCPGEAGLDMIENYMDYTDDDCMTLFTAGQNVRIQAALMAPRRGILGQSSACMPPSAIPTMGQWGLFILALMMSSLALVFIGYKRDAKELV